ncbi:hypothetical protein SAMN05216412_11032 [Nitrosospira multiformis]|uniref:Uncharacterized protein n=1 Tax=Nitrosospira multiformis TaxID=1231 RepID=A0A1I0FS40_9PROT|nr:hypothetical protein [Nitrosospira multiformis]SET61196.1 hypothetical protein SAMN05216412_11032 [Nitrosospira multiformis]
MQTISNEERLFQILERIEQKLSPPALAKIALWNTDDIAVSLRRDRGTVMGRVVCLPSFPKAIRLPSATGGRGRPLWKAAEVIR